ncbi:MAG: LysM peptidoglycan-binding domain-containing protein [Ardenticatenaceae bacterium]|nr:LysM peptidoglycan-binding domain-containing protein [Anaerolineales bacterium]MCB8982850.1 LysM peptidoglycan-binding domain-containing protein [Ardenticatenaceae bacterium]
MPKANQQKVGVSVLLAIVMLVGLLPLAALAQTEPAAPPTGGEAPIPFVHHVQEGENLTFIATTYGISVGDLLAANGLGEDALLAIGQPLIIPGREGQPVETTYIVQAGDTLAAVAADFNTSLTAVARSNHLINPHQELTVGQALSVTSRTGSEAAAGLTGTPTVVAPGETLTLVAARTGTSVEDLMAANGLDTGVVFPGQRLRIPGDQPYRALPGTWVDVRIRPSALQQGSAVSVYVENLLDGLPTGQLAGHSLHFAPQGDGYVALAGLDAFTEPGTYTLELGGSGSQPWPPLSQKVTVASAGYGTQYITIPEELSALLDPALRQNEDAFLDTIYTRFSDTQLWDGLFQAPVTTTVVTAPYGDSRSYNDGPIEIFHTGVDFAGGIGTPILAPANGVVVYANELELRGNTVILDHGLGVMTAYFHLSEILVNEGEKVTTGQPLGLGGSTGLSNGPHLHWDLRVNGVAVDGMQWTTTTFP